MSGDTAARYRVYVTDVVQYLGLYRPGQLEFPACLDGVSVEAVLAASRAETPTDEQKLILAAFGQWRHDVIRLEVRNDKHLSTLANALAQTAKRPPSIDWPEAQQHRTQLERHLRTVWRLEPPAVGENLREWAAQHARRPDLLPLSWRQL